MADRIGYVLIEYNQASRQPGLPVAAEMYDSIEDARYALKVEERDMRPAGRGEAYIIAEVIPLEEDDA